MKLPHMLGCWFAGLAMLGSGVTAHAENWPQFRGPGGQGESTETHLPLSWSETDNVAWKITMPGAGWSSPIVWGDRLFLTYTTPDGLGCHVLCVSRGDGKRIWDTEVFNQSPTRKEGKNSFASPTPVTDGTMVYAVFKEGSIVALSNEGKIAWINRDYPFYNQHGMGASPIIHQDMLIIPYDQSAKSGDLLMGWQKPWDGGFVLALDKATGKQRWKTMRGMSRIGHTTPRIVDIDGKTQLLSGAGDVLQGFEPLTGKLIWWTKNTGESVVPTPVIGDGLIFTQSGWNDITIRAWRASGTGDITHSALVWELKKAVPTIPSYAFSDHHLYTLKEDGILQCIDAATGKVAWKQRLEGSFSASPVVADGRIYCLAEDGTTTVIPDHGDFTVLATSPLNDTVQASMAVSAGQFFIRTQKTLFCIGKGK